MQFPPPIVPPARGATTFRRFEAGDDIECLRELFDDAYSAYTDLSEVGRNATRERLRANVTEKDATLIGAYRDGAFVAAMRWYDYALRFRTVEVFAGGLGAVAVALDRRKQGIARDLVAAFVETYRARGAIFALLHPFQHAFYRQMGFGHGTKMSQYRFAVRTLSGGGSHERVSRLRETDVPALMESYARLQARTNGFIGLSEAAARRPFGDSQVWLAGYRDAAGTLRGYVRVRPCGENSNLNELIVEEMHYESPEALAGLLAFFRALGDQFPILRIDAQDESLHWLSSDPRDGSGRIVLSPAYHQTNVQGAGLMYRALDVGRALDVLAEDECPAGEATVALEVRDTFLPANAGRYVVSFSGGRLARVPEAVPDAVVALDVAELSSLLVGSVRLRSLYDYGLATVSDPARVDMLDRLFAADRPPRCTTRF